MFGKGRIVEALIYSKKCYELYCSCCLKNKSLPCLRYVVCITLYAVLCIVLNLDIYTYMHYINSSRKFRSFLPYSGRPVCMSSSHTLAWFSFTLCRGRLLPSPLRDREWSLCCSLYHLHCRWGGLLYYVHREVLHRLGKKFLWGRRKNRGVSLVSIWNKHCCARESFLQFFTLVTCCCVLIIRSRLS